MCVYVFNSLFVEERLLSMWNWMNWRWSSDVHLQPVFFCFCPRYPRKQEGHQATQLVLCSLDWITCSAVLAGWFQVVLPCQGLCWIWKTTRCLSINIHYLSWYYLYVSLNIFFSHNDILLPYIATCQTLRPGDHSCWSLFRSNPICCLGARPMD